MRLTGLDVIRGLAAVLVAVHHLQTIYGFQLFEIAAISAVDLFFVLSGFVMARTYDSRFDRGLTAGKFVLIRYRRLWPCMAVAALLGYTVAQASPAALAAILLFLPYPYAGMLFKINVVVWSLFVEIIANALHRFVKGHMLWIVLATSCAIFIPASLSANTTFWGSDFYSLFIATARGIACYIVGISVFRRYGDRPIGGHWIAFIGLPVLLILGAQMPDGLFSVVFGLLVAPIIIRMSLSYSGSDWMLGALSFPLYAIHIPTMKISFSLDWPIWIAVALCVAGAFVLTTLLDRRWSPQVA